MHRNRRHGQRRQKQHQRHACHHEDDEQRARHRPHAVAEALLQIGVGGADLQAAEERQEIGNHREGDDEDEYLHGVVLPVGGVGLGGNRHVGNGAEHGGKDAHARSPPRYASAAGKEVVAVLLAVHEVEAQPKHGQQIDNQHQPVEPAEAGVIAHADAGGVGRAHAGLALAVDDEPPVGAAVGIVHHPTAGAGEGRGALHLAPRVGDGIIY